MRSPSKFRQLTFISITSMLAALVISHPADAKSLKIGVVKHDLTSGLCFAYIPGSKKEMLIVPFTTKTLERPVARLNIDGQNVRLRQISKESTAKKSIAKYQSQNISLTVESTTVEEREEPSYYSKTLENISIKSKGITKTINTTGGCKG